MALESVRQIGVAQCRYTDSQRRAENREVQTTFSVISGQMGGKRVKTYRRRLSDAVFETSRILQIHNCCLEYGQR